MELNDYVVTNGGTGKVVGMDSEFVYVHLDGQEYQEGEVDMFIHDEIVDVLGQ